MEDSTTFETEVSTTVHEQSGRVEPGRLKQAVAHLVGAGIGLNQGFLAQGQQQVANLRLRNSAACNNRYHRSQSGASRKNRQPSQQQFLCLAQEGVAPIDQGLQRLMPGPGGAAASGEKKARPEAVSK